MDKQANTSGGKKHFLYLDGFRGIAILMVLFAHFHGFIYNIGHMGVELFFVLSGLLMGRILFIDKVPLRVFYRNRIARIFPVLYLYILVLSWLAWRYHYGVNAGDLLYSALFLRTYFGGTSIWEGGNLPLSHLWSLNVEEHCYILLSVVSVLALARSRRAAGMALLLLSLMCIGFFRLYEFHPPQSPSPVFLRTECAGFSIFISATLLIWLQRLQPKVPSFVPPAALAAGLLIGAFARYGLFLYVISPLLLAVAVNTLEHAPRWMHSALGNKVLAWFGVCSYSIYIWQQLFFFLIERHDVPIRLMGLGMALGIGTLSYYFYERPLRRWIRNGETLQEKRSSFAPAYAQAA